MSASKSVRPQLVNPVITGALNSSSFPNTITATGAVTLTIAYALGQFLSLDPGGAGRTATTPTAALIIAGAGMTNEGQAVEFLLKNAADAAESITIAAGTGVTLLGGTYVVAQNEWATIRYVRTSSTTCVAIVKILAA